MRHAQLNLSLVHRRESFRRMLEPSSRILARAEKRVARWVAEGLNGASHATETGILDQREEKPPVS